ncbi:MAG: alpha/beta hydrolase [Maritimibacter harenae]
MAERFHPDLKRARRMSRQAVSPATLRPYRALLSLGGALTGRGVEKASGPTGQPIWVYRPPGDGPHPALLWIHGGGLVFGHPLTERRFATEVRDDLGALVACPTYRFAPEHPYPAALDDVYAALTWLAEQPGVDPDRIAVGGDSAGGGLAAALAIRARDRGGPKIAFQLLHEPMLDEATRHAPPPAPDTLRLWSHGINRWAWDGYLRGVEGDVPATASPARLTDASGLPPAWIGVGTRDLFHGEATDYAAHLRDAGIATELHEVDGAYHGFVQTEGSAPVARDYVARMKAALERAWRVT